MRRTTPHLLATLLLAVSLALPACSSREGQGPVTGVGDVDDGVERPDWARPTDTTGTTPDEPDAAAPDEPTPDAGPTEPDVPPEPDVPDEPEPAGPAPEVLLGTWNLHNFSAYGASEWRLEDLEAEIATLAPDVLGVQELKLEDDTTGEDQQAFDVLVANLEDYEGVHNPWQEVDTTVGLLYRPETTTILGTETLFEGQWYPFPRPPLEVDVRVTKGDRSVELTLLVLHLKAFQDGYDRRKEACEKLDGYIQGLPSEDRRYVVLGDLNDDPYDEPDLNAFHGTFVNNAPTYDFVTHTLPPESVTSMGWYHYVDGKKIDGEFLDHVIVTGELAADFETLTPVIHGVGPDDHWWYGDKFSDHFPVLVTLTPPE